MRKYRYKPHRNMFGQGATRAEAYAEYKRNADLHSRFQVFWFVVFFIAGLMAVGINPEFFWLFVGMFAISKANDRFTEMSNVNWAMHVMDWVHDRRINDEDLHDPADQSVVHPPEAGDSKGVRGEVRKNR